MKKSLLKAALVLCLIYGETGCRAGESVMVPEIEPFRLPLTVEDLDHLVTTWRKIRKADSLDACVENWQSVEKRSDLNSNASLIGHTDISLKFTKKISLTFDVPSLLASNALEHRGFADLIQGCMKRFRMEAGKYGSLSIDEKPTKAVIEVFTFQNFRDDPFNGHDCMWIKLSAENRSGGANATWCVWLDSGNPLFEPAPLPSSKLISERRLEKSNENDVDDDYKGIIRFIGGSFASPKAPPIHQRKSPPKKQRGK